MSWHEVEQIQITCSVYIGKIGDNPFQDRKSEFEISPQ